MSAGEMADAVLERMKPGRELFSRADVRNLIAHGILDERQRQDQVRAGEALLGLLTHQFHGDETYSYVVPEESEVEPAFIAVDMKNARAEATLKLTHEEAVEFDHRLQDLIKEMEEPR